MATVYIQKRKCKSRNSYAIRYIDPITFKTKHYKTFRRHRDAIYAAHDLRMMIDHGKLYEIPKSKYQLNLLTFEGITNRTKQLWCKSALFVFLPNSYQKPYHYKEPGPAGFFISKGFESDTYPEEKKPNLRQFK